MQTQTCGWPFLRGISRIRDGRCDCRRGLYLRLRAIALALRRPRLRLSHYFADVRAASTRRLLYSSDSDGTQKYSHNSAFGRSSILPFVVHGFEKTKGSMMVISASSVP